MIKKLARWLLREELKHLNWYNEFYREEVNHYKLDKFINDMAHKGGWRGAPINRSDHMNRIKTMKNQLALEEEKSMRELDKSIVLELCEGHPQEIQNIIKAAYWHGCRDGLVAAKSTEHKIKYREDNVIFLKTDP